MRTKAYISKRRTYWDFEKKKDSSEFGFQKGRFLLRIYIETTNTELGESGLLIFYKSYCEAALGSNTRIDPGMDSVQWNSM